MPRPVAHLANLDLNLLVALRELLRERSVTRAAERLGVTQPAASAALSRLRRHFGDELLIRDRGEYTLTALGAPAEQALWWHRQYEDDTAHAWLRRLITETARRL